MNRRPIRGRLCTGYSCVYWRADTERYFVMVKDETGFPYYGSFDKLEDAIEMATNIKENKNG